MTHWLYHALDAFDHWVLRHRVYRLCHFIGVRTPEGCGCRYSRYWEARHKREMEE